MIFTVVIVFVQLGLRLNTEILGKILGLPVEKSIDQMLHTTTQQLMCSI